MAFSGLTQFTSWAWLARARAVSEPKAASSRAAGTSDRSPKRTVSASTGVSASGPQARNRARASWSARRVSATRGDTAAA
jgi:hypothetical protein